MAVFDAVNLIIIIIIIIIIFKATFFFYIKYGFQKESHKNTKYTQIREDVKRLKYVKTNKMYKILTQIQCSPLFAPIPFDTWNLKFNLVLAMVL